MNKPRLTHWIITGAISFFMLFSAYISGTRVTEFAHLGFPNYFRLELTIAKIIGAIVLLFPQTPARVREWIYVSFTIVLISAAIAKYNSGYPLKEVAEPLVVLTIMVSSVLYLNKSNRPKSALLRPSLI